MINVNRKGTIAEAKILARFIETGYEVFTPFSDANAIDMVVADEAGTLRRIQVKYRTIEKKTPNRLIIQMDSIVNGKRIPVNRNLIDAYAVYNPDHDRIVFIPNEYLPLKTNTFVLVPEERKSSLVILDEKFSDPRILWNCGRVV